MTEQFDRQGLGKLTELYLELSLRDATARAIADLKSEGRYDPDLHAKPENNPPLRIREHLDLLSIGAAITRIVMHPAHVDYALQAGATVADIALALCTSVEKVRADYLEWLDGQVNIRTAYSDIGITAEEAEQRRALVHGDSGPTSPVSTSRVTDGIDTRL